MLTPSLQHLDLICNSFVSRIIMARKCLQFEQYLEKCTMCNLVKSSEYKGQLGKKLINSAYLHTLLADRSRYARLTTCTRACGPRLYSNIKLYANSPHSLVHLLQINWGSRNNS